MACLSFHILVPCTLLNNFLRDRRKAEISLSAETKNGLMYSAETEYSTETDAESEFCLGPIRPRSLNNRPKSINIG